MERNVTTFDVTATLEEIDFAPSDVVKEIIQNVRTIFSTMKYTVPLDRLFGLDATVIDKPMPVAIALLQADIIRAVNRYEPRCRVVRVAFDGDVQDVGKLVPRVRIRIDEERLVSDTA